MRVEALREIIADYDKSTNAKYFFGAIYSLVGKNIEQDPPIIASLRGLSQIEGRVGNEVILRAIYHQKLTGNTKDARLLDAVMSACVWRMYRELTTEDCRNGYSVNIIFDALVNYGIKQLTPNNVNQVILHAHSNISARVSSALYEQLGLEEKPETPIVDIGEIIKDAVEWVQSQEGAHRLTW